MNGIKRWKRTGIILLLAMSCAIYGGMTVNAAASETAFAFSYDRVFDGIYGEESVYYEIPGYWKVEQAKAVIHVELSPMLIDIPATLTFQVNGTPVSSVELDYAKGGEQTFVIPLKAEQLPEGSNRFSVTGFAQIFDEEGCLDEFSGANWVILKEDSCVQVKYRMQEPSYRISEYPYPLISSANANGEDVAVVIMDGGSAGELTAAAWVRAGLSQHVEGEDRIVTEGWLEYQKNPSSAVLISSYGESPDEVRDLLRRNGVKETDLEEQGAIFVRETEEGLAQVWIISKNEECLAEAARLLMDESRLSQEKEAVALVPLGSSAELREKSGEENGEILLSDWLDGGSGLEFRGSFRQEQTVYPADGIRYVLSAEDSMTWKFRYSDNLDFDRSLLTVYINGIPVASKKLEKEKADGDELTMGIPEDLNGEKLETITFAFDLEIEDLYCTVRLDEMPWGFVSGDSRLSLLGEQSTFYSFDIMPWPFVKGGNSDGILFVLPEKPGREDLELFGQLASYLGESMKPYGEMRAVTGGEFKQEDAAGANLIFTGSIEDQPLLSEVREGLPFSVDLEAKKLLGNSSFAFSDSYARTTGVMELIPSPYNQEKVLLVATAADRTGISSLAEYLSDLSGRQALEGDAVLVDTGLSVRSFVFRDERGENDRPALRERLEQNRESVVFALVSTAAMMLMLLASILIWIRAYSLKKKEGGKK